MSRWWWALLAGVVLVSGRSRLLDKRDECPAPGLAGHVRRVAPAPAPASTAQNAAPLGSVSSPSPPSAPGGGSPVRSRTPAPDAGQTRPPRRLPRPRRPLRKSPRLPRSSRRSLRPRLLSLPWPNHPCRRPRPDGRRLRKVAGIYALQEHLAQLVGTWAYSAADCERLFQRRGGGWAYREPVDKFAQAAIVGDRRRKILSPFRNLPD